VKLKEGNKVGATFSAVFEAEVPPYGTLGADHLALLRVRTVLDRLAVNNGLTSLLAFESYAPEDMEVEEELLDKDLQAQQPPVEWFPPAAGVAAIDALWNYLDAHPGVVPGQAEVMEDLSDIGDELEAAQRAGVRFRFTVIL
jgi:hypothetical protein